MTTRKEILATHSDEQLCERLWEFSKMGGFYKNVAYGYKREFINKKYLTENQRHIIAGMLDVENSDSKPKSRMAMHGDL